MIWFRLARGVVCAALVLVVAPVASAQSLDQEVLRLLGANCVQLGLYDGNNGNPGQVGPNLDAICRDNNAAPNGGTSGGGAASPQGSGSLLVQRNEEQRVESLRDGEEGTAEDVLQITNLFQVQGLGVWATGDYTRRDRDVTFFEDGYDSDVLGAGGGIDYRFAEIAFAGLAYDYQNTDADFTGGGGFDTDSHGVTLYGSLEPTSQLFLDGAVSYAWKDYEVERPVSYTETSGAGVVTLAQRGIADGDTDGQEVSARAIAGYDHVIGSVTLGPRAGVNFVHTDIDGYTERGSTGIELVHSDRTRQSLQSVVGASASTAISMGFGVLIPQLDFEWAYEFQDDQRHHSVRFVEDLRASPVVFSYQNEKPDRSFFYLNPGLLLALPYGVQVFAQYQTILDHDDFDSHGVAAGVRVELGGVN